MASAATAKNWPRVAKPRCLGVHAQEDLVYEGGGLEGVAGVFLGHAAAGELAELVVDFGEEAGESLGIVPGGRGGRNGGLGGVGHGCT